jgi:acyl-CoA synthetase (AMP-forming)/AMP-acid ligase II
MTTKNLLIGDVFANAARAVPDRDAVVLGDDSLSFAELDATADRWAATLGPLGVGRGSRVVLWSATHLGAVPLFAALSKMGAIFVPVNGLLGEGEAADILSGCRPVLVVTDTARLVPAAIPSITLDQLGERASSSDPVPAHLEGLSGSDPHVAFFTSGSTGRPKGAVLSHETSYLRTHPGALLEPRGAMVCPYPLFHMGAWTIALQQWQARDTVVLLESAGAEEICTAVDRSRATRLNCVPAVWRRIIEHAATVGSGVLSSLRFADTGTSATPLELLSAIEETLPEARLRVFYGSTEAGSVACLDHADIRRKPGSCGPPAPGVTARVDEDGELWVASPVLFDGYLDDPEATAECLVGGWYRTGDLAEEDADGYLSIVGRTGDVIRTGGETVVPVEVEAVLAELPGLAEVAVVGVADPTWGQVVCAVVVVAPGGPEPTVEMLRRHCQGRLAAFKHPRRLRVVDALPRTAATGQVRRRLLATE